MSTAIGKVAAVFSASTSGLVAGVNQAKSAFSSLEASAKSTASGMRALVAIQGAQLFGSIASAATGYVRSLIQIGQAQAEVIDRTSKLAARLGMTYGELSGLALAGDLAGVSMDQIGAAATKADVAFVKAAGGSKTALAAFNRLGVSMADLAGMNPAQRFEAIASAIAGLPTEAERAAAAVQLFGRSGAELLPLFSGGADAIREAREEAEQFGLALTTAQGQDVEAMNDAFTRVKKVVEGITNQVVAYLAPAIKSVSDAFVQLVGGMGGASIGQAIGDALLNGALALARIVDYMVDAFSSVTESLDGQSSKWDAVFATGVRAAGFLEAGFRVGSFLMSNIVGMFADVLSLALSSVASVASMVPGLGVIAKSIQGAADQMARSSDAWLENSRSQLAQAGEAINEVITGEFAPAIGSAAGGVATAMIQGAIDRARGAAAELQNAKPAALPQIEQVVQVEGVTEALKGIDSRSKEGVSEMFRIMRGDAGNIQQQQLTVLEQIAENTADQGEPPWVMDVPN